MTEPLERAIFEFNKLPTEKQNAVAQWILNELRDETLPQLEQFAGEGLADLMGGQSRTAQSRYWAMWKAPEPGRSQAVIELQT